MESTEEQIADPGFWNSPETSQRVMQERKRLEKAVSDDFEVLGLTEEIETLFELGREGEAVSGEIAQELKKLAARLDELEPRMLLIQKKD
ncbi:MAG: PCRF domain-containing protein, partial [Acidobacteriota bacterium]